MTTQDRAEEIARWNPRHAIKGWLAGCRSEGHMEEAAEYEAALLIQEDWKKEVAATQEP